MELFQPRRPRGEPRDPSRPKGLVVALHEQGKLRKLLHSEVGRLRLDDLIDDWPVSMEVLARRHDASVAIALEVGALDAVMDGLGDRLRRVDDMTTQWLTFFELMQEQTHLGRLQMWPHRLEGIPIPTASMVDRTLDSVFPPGKTMLLGLFDGDSLWTCLALQRGLQGIERIVGPDELRPALGLLSGDHRRDHRHLVRVVSDYLARCPLAASPNRKPFANCKWTHVREPGPTPSPSAMSCCIPCPQPWPFHWGWMQDGQRLVHCAEWASTLRVHWPQRWTCCAKLRLATVRWKKFSGLIR